MQASYNRASGFSVVEIITVITVMGLLAGVVFGTLGGFYQSNTISLGQSAQDTDTRSVLRKIEKDLSRSAGFITTLAVSSPLGSKNDATSWYYKGNDSAHPNNRVLISRVYATDKSTDDETRMPIFVNTGTGCDPSTSPLAQNAYIYFIAEDLQTTGQYNLYRRTITGISGGTMCGTPFQKQSCSIDKAGGNPSVCKATDSILLYDVDSLDVQYYTSSNDSSPIDSYSASPPAGTDTLVENAKTVVLTVTTNRLINGYNNPYSTSIRISRSY